VHRQEYPRRGKKGLRYDASDEEILQHMEIEQRHRNYVTAIRDPAIMEIEQRHRN
jgi:hypothetical protein